MSGSMIGGIDSSIPLQAGKGVQQPNPLQQIGQFANASNALNQLKLFPGQQQLQQQAIQGGNVDLASKIKQAAYSSLVPLLSSPNITHDQVTTALASAEHNLGLPTNGVIQDIMATAPTGDGPEFNAKMRSLITSRSMVSPESAVHMVTPSSGPVLSNGQNLIPTTVAPPSSATPGVVSSAGSQVPVYPSRSELAGQVGRPTTAEESAVLGVPIGTPLQETMLQRLQNQGQGGLAGPAGVVGVNGPVGPQNQPRLAPTAPAVTPATPAVAPAAPAPGPRPIVGGLAPGAGTEMEASATHYAADNLAANSFRQRIFPLSQAAVALKSADTGPGSETVNHIKSFLLAQSPDSLRKYLPGVDPDKIANYDEAVKYLANYAMQQPGAAQSDMHLGLAQVANASTHISNQAAQQVVQNALGIERMRQAATLEFNATHPTGSGQQYDRWLSEFSTTHDPRGFSWDDQNPAQRDAALKSMSRADKERLARSVTLARRYELTGAPGG